MWLFSPKIAVRREISPEVKGSSHGCVLISYLAHEPPGAPEERAEPCLPPGRCLMSCSLYQVVLSV